MRWRRGVWGPLTPVSQAMAWPESPLKTASSSMRPRVKGDPKDSWGHSTLTPRAWLCPLGQLELEPDTEIESWMEAGVEGVLD